MEGESLGRKGSEVEKKRSRHDAWKWIWGEYSVSPLGMWLCKNVTYNLVQTRTDHSPAMAYRMYCWVASPDRHEKLYASCRGGAASSPGCNFIPPLTTLSCHANVLLAVVIIELASDLCVSQRRSLTVNVHARQLDWPGYNSCCTFV